MTLHKKDTEKLILETAKRIFFKDGNLNATTQEIADAAQVNRTLVHYYFRSRDALFQQVFLEGKNELRTNLSNVFSKDISFREKIEQLIDTYNSFIQNYPYQEIFLINAVNCKQHSLFDLGEASIEHQERMLAFIEEIRKQMDLGIIKRMEPEIFLMNIYAMISYPIMMKPLYTKVFCISSEAMEAKLQERKRVIMELFFQS